MLNRTRRFIREHPDLSLLLVLLSVVGLAQLFLGSRPSPIASAEALQTRLSAGEPTVVEFYSNL